MGFVAKSTFWLGVVYSAMPFDSGALTAPAPTADATPHATSSSLESFANAVIPGSRQNQDGWKSAAEVAAAFCAHDCLRPLSAGFSLPDVPPRNGRAEPTRREKSSREGAVRPSAANHIRSQDRQT